MSRMPLLPTLIPALLPHLYSNSHASALSHFARALFRLTTLPALLTLALVGFVPQANAQPDPVQKPSATSRLMLAGLQDAFAEVAEKVEPAVVTVLSIKSRRTPTPRPEMPKSEPGSNPKEMGGPEGPSRRRAGTGSGVIISPDGWVLTNDHVIGGADKVTIRLHDGREFAGSVRRDRRSDLAMVKIESQSPFPFLPLGDSDKVKIGHWAIAIGSPYRYEGSFSLGVISSLGRRQQIADASVPSGTRIYSNMIQTDAAINPGNSGGPLCNLDGEVIGINTAIESETGGSVGIGFAIPANAVRFVSDQLRTKGHVDYGYLGVSFVSLTNKTSTLLKAPYGAVIDEEPAADTPAATAGLHVSDVVTALNDHTIRTDNDFRVTIGQTPPGTAVELTVIRAGETLKLHATLLRAAEDLDEIPAPMPKPQIGIEVANAAPLIVTQTANTGAVGVIVTSIDPDSPASEIRDLKPGATILRVNGKETPTPQAFQAALANVRPGDQVILVYLTANDKPTKRLAIVNVD